MAASRRVSTAGQPRRCGQAPRARAGRADYYTPEEVEAIAWALEEGRHRDPSPPDLGARSEMRACRGSQDAELIRLAAYAGLRQGELLALNWGDVEFAGRALTVSRAMSAGIEPRRSRGGSAASRFPIRLPRRWTAPVGGSTSSAADDLVLQTRLAATRRLRAAPAIPSRSDCGRVRALSFHDLRHTFGSHLAVAGVDVVTIKSAMGHSALPRPSDTCMPGPREQAQLFSRRLRPSRQSVPELPRRSRTPAKLRPREICCFAAITWRSRYDLWSNEPTTGYSVLGLFCFRFLLQ